MAELTFSEEDGQLRLHFGSAVARLEGRGKISISGPILSPQPRFTVRRQEVRMRILQRITAAMSIILFLAVAGLLLWRWIGGDQIPAFVSVTAEVASFALLGSLVSLGGVSLLSVQGAVSAESERIETLQARCPFESITLDSGNGQQPGCPEFCAKCLLGVDTITKREHGFLIHNCRVYDGLHRRWLQSHAGQEFMRRQV